MLALGRKSVGWCRIRQGHLIKFKSGMYGFVYYFQWYPFLCCCSVALPLLVFYLFSAKQDSWMVYSNFLQPFFRIELILQQQLDRVGGIGVLAVYLFNIFYFIFVTRTICESELNGTIRWIMLSVSYVANESTLEIRSAPFWLPCVSKTSIQSRLKSTTSSWTLRLVWSGF